ncbi:MAG: hypothetical protein FWD89_00795 [Firmicutes bacterium]|nr:hypothetical protein [Bacillota bacterium]MCL2770833.1 hypothetical protein [Bacillota bacterium]
MKKELKIKKVGNKTIIKFPFNKLFYSLVLTVTTIFILSVIFEEEILKSIPLIIALSIALLAAINTCVLLFFRKLVINTETKKMTYFYFRRKTFSWDDIISAEVEVVEDSSGEGGTSYHYQLIINLSNNKIIKVITHSEGQAEELRIIIAMIKTM